jgi:Bacterial Ig-like domain (group 3)
MGSHLERVFPCGLAAKLWSDVASLGRGHERGRRRFEAVLLPLEDRRLLSTFPVTSTADNSNTGTLRWAVAEANAATSPSTIVFELGSASATITLTQGQLDLSNSSESVTIDDGTGQGPVTISGNNQSGAFQVDSGVTASITGLTITGGATLVNSPHGGSINDLGTLTLSDCTITNNPQSTNPVSGIYIDGTADITDCTISGENSYHGAGVDVSDGTADLTGCTIEDNTGARDVDGAGVYNKDGTTTLVNCTISGNSAVGGGSLYNFSYGQLKVYGCTISGNSNSGADGGGVYNRGTAYLSDCTIDGNSNENFGGGVCNLQGTIDLSGCTISGNDAVRGGGLENDGTATITDCTISQNTVWASGGGVSSGLDIKTSNLTLTDSTISDNTDLDYDSYGGGGVGVINYGQATLTDSTIANNVADNGDGTQISNGTGLADLGTATVVACTISGNTTNASGGGIYVGGTGAGTLTLNNTIVAGNVSVPTDGGASPNDIIADASGAVVSGSNNLVGTGGSAGLSSSTNLLGVADPGLAPLGDNGGPTETMALLTGSPAIGAGSAALEVGPGGTSLTTDQRGEPLDFPTPDIGAYQTQSIISLSFTGLTSPSVTYGTASVTISGTLANGDLAPPDTESVQITLDGVTQSAAFGSGGAFSTTFGTSTLPASATPYTVTYSYAGVANFAAAATTSTLTVGQATPSVSVSINGGAYNGSAFNATTTVAGVSGQAAASLEGITPAPVYYAGSTATGTPLTGAPTDAGTYTVVATFAGSADYAAHTSAAVTFTIAKATPTVSVATPGGTYTGSAFNATAYVTGVSGPAAAQLEGAAPTLTYYAGSTATGTPLPGAPIQAGTYTVVAAFPGSTDYVARPSQPVTFTISPGSSTVTLNASAPSVVYGQSVTLVATVTAPGATPSGTVTFSDGGTTLGTIALDASGQATLTTSGLAVAPHSITATYNGDANEQGATSVPVAESVARASTQVVLVTNPIAKKKKVVSVGLTAEVMPIAPGGGVPTGAVIFEVIVKGKGKKSKTKEQVLGTVTLAGGGATLTLKADQVLKKLITIAYSGDPDFASSTAMPPALTQQALRSLARPMVAMPQHDRAPR